MSNNVNTGSGKKRHNICISRDVRRMGARLEKAERRSFSGLIEILIQREHERLFQAPPAKL